MRRIGDVMPEPEFYQWLREPRRRLENMPRNGTYGGFEPNQYGGKVIIQTQRGPWKMDNRTGSQPQIPMGTPVTFEATKQGNYWHCTAIQASGGQPPSQAYQQPAQQAQAPLAYHADVAPGVSKECGMFVMGIIGRAMQGTGTVPDANTLTHMVANVRTAWEAAMEGKEASNEPAITDFPPQSESPNPNDWQ